MLCPNCNIEIKDYCVKCGYYNGNGNAEIKERKRRNHKWVFPFIIILIIVSIISSIFIKDYIKRSHITPVSELKMDVNSKEYINELYISDEHTYNYLLDEDEKKLYREVIDKIKNYDTKMTLDLTKKGFKQSYFSADYFITINDAIFMDHPELIHFAYISYREVSKHIYEIEFNYVLDKEKYNAAIKEMKLLLEEIKDATKEFSDVDKVKYVYEWLGKRNEYNYSFPAISQSAYSAFNLELSPVCAGYARAAQIIFQNIGIDSLLINGSLNNGAHEWNFVKLDNQYYYLDITTTSTSNDPVINGISYAGYLFSDHRGYRIDNKEVVPMALGRKYIFKQ